MLLPKNGLSQMVHRLTTETGVSSQWAFLIQVGPYKSHMWLKLNLKDRKMARYQQHRKTKADMSASPTIDREHQPDEQQRPS
jgi:hypothetical protein